MLRTRAASLFPYRPKRPKLKEKNDDQNEGNSKPESDKSAELIFFSLFAERTGAYHSF
jgi:hypothetical protein